MQFGDLVFIGGQTSDKETADIRTQTAQVLSTIDKFLQTVGIDRTRILSAQVWLADIAGLWALVNPTANSHPVSSISVLKQRADQVVSVANRP
jgi:enamine deaminase RidA (YjgF/YER057c/UK114 family)